MLLKLAIVDNNIVILQQHNRHITDKARKKQRSLCCYTGCADDKMFDTTDAEGETGEEEHVDDDDDAEEEDGGDE